MYDVTVHQTFAFDPKRPHLPVYRRTPMVCHGSFDRELITDGAITHQRNLMEHPSSELTGWAIEWNGVCIIAQSKMYQF